MNNYIAQSQKSDLINGFKWRSRDGSFRTIKDMGTGHLFNTFVMIWNHHMPHEARTRNNYRRYAFGPYYTPQYLMQAIKEMFPALIRREDITQGQRITLHRMASYFMFKQPQGFEDVYRDLEDLKNDTALPSE